MCSDQEIGAHRSLAGSKVLWFDGSWGKIETRFTLDPYSSKFDFLRRWYVGLNYLLRGSVVVTTPKIFDSRDDGNMRVLEYRALDRRSSKPVDHKWRKSWMNFLPWFFWLLYLQYTEFHDHSWLFIDKYVYFVFVLFVFSIHFWIQSWRDDYKRYWCLKRHFREKTFYALVCESYKFACEIWILIYSRCFHYS